MATTRSFRIILIILVFLQLLYGLALAMFSLPGFPRSMDTGGFFPYLSDKPVGEDGYYMLTVAWNIASGKGIVYNYQQPTTGIQPLSTFLDASIAWMVQMLGGDKWIFTRVILFMGTIYLLVFAHLTGRIAASIASQYPVVDQYSYVIAFLVTLFNYGLFRIFAYGLETGLYMILLSLNVLFTIKLFRGEPNYWKAAGFGFLAGLTILARMDFVIVFGVFLLLGMFKKQFTILWGLVALGIALLSASPWFIFVFLTTGGLIPSSGSAQASLVGFPQLAGRIWEMIRSLISHFVPWIYSRPSILLSFVAVFILLLIFYALIRNRNTRTFAVSVIKTQVIFQNWCLGLLVIVAVYLIAFEAVHFYTRYTAPIQVVLIPLGSAILAFFFTNTKGKKMFATLLLLPCLFLIWSLITLHTGVITNSQAVLAGYVMNEFPSQVKVGAFQSGVAGYFNSNVVNLDGKMNRDALEAEKNGKLADYIDEENITVLVDWPEVINKKLPAQYIQDNWKSCKRIVPDGKSICLVRIQPH